MDEANDKLDFIAASEGGKSLTTFLDFFCCLRQQFEEQIKYLMQFYVMLIIIGLINSR